MRKVIVFASFGVADAKVRANSLDRTSFEIARAYPQYAVVQAYTSDFIRERMLKQGMRALSVTECLEELLDSGCEEVYIQPAHLTRGEEYEKKIVAVAEEYAPRFKKLRVGEPLFCHDYDYDDVLAALTESLERREDETIVLMGHGSPKRRSDAYEILQEKADKLGLPITLGVLEKSDKPTLDDVIKRLKERNVVRVLLAPLLMVGGMHVTEDMTGKGRESWESRLKEEGFEVRVDQRSLGEYPAFRTEYIKKVGRLLERAD